ncbi:MAG: NAD(P)/FAD-dependent oxidoreductase [Eubacteriaceae bacterium]|nr:NAD(P)/FAD-dependent oxidoreductase [Eubacteriaceae bacterium]
MGTVVIVGGGASGMAAAVEAGRLGKKTLLLEQNEKLGKKIYITGKGRCNFTNACEPDVFMDSIFEGKNFAYSSVWHLPPERLIDMLNSVGLKSVIERGNRVFPESSKASDVTKAFEKLMRQNGTEIRLGQKVGSIVVEGNRVVGVVSNGQEIFADSVILATGGKSYPSTGSDGNGYDLAAKLGHTVSALRPALTGMAAKKEDISGLVGLSLKNTKAELRENGKPVAADFGEMLFTHNGISGPIILTLSCHCGNSAQYEVALDLKTGLTSEALDRRMLSDFKKNTNKSAKYCLDGLLPKRLAEFVVAKSGINPSKPINQITAYERLALVGMLKEFRIKIEGLNGYNEAIITAGGISLSAIKPSTLESKLVGGLFFAGEMLAVHGYTGGFNLQLAFSTGSLAGYSA